MADYSKLFVGIPTRGTVNYNTVQRLLQMQEKYPEAIYHLEAGGLSVSHVRNRIVHRFLTETDCTHLLQIDDDVLPRLNAPEMMHMPHDIIGATYLIVRAETNLPFPSGKGVDHIYF